MKTKKFKAIVTLVMLLLMVGCISQTKASSLKDFSITLCNVEREDKETTLYLAVTKVSEGKSDFMLKTPKTKKEYKSQLIRVPIALIDDHENRYDGKLHIDLNYKYGGGVFVDYFPKGFTYVDTVEIRMPKIAPIEKVKIGDKEIPFKKAKLAKPKFPKDFGNFTGIKGQKVRVGKWLSFTMGEKVIPAGRIWQFPLVIENEDYNPASIDMTFGTQLHDGRTYWHDSSGYRKKIEGLSKFSGQIGIVNGQYCGYTEEFTYPIAFIVIGINESTLEASLRIFPLSLSEFPILVGQGAKETQKIFTEAYDHNGGREVMGDPINLPHWFAGDDKPKDENDVVIQEFPAVSDFGKSAIVWDKQGDANKAYVIHGSVWEKYLSIQGPYAKVQGVSLGVPLRDQYKSAMTGYPKCDFENGYIATCNGINYEVTTLAYPEEIFLQAYQRNGGREVMGDPINLPHWFAGDDKPKDENDVVIQEFPAVSDFGKSAIVWDKQGDANKAYVIHGSVWEKYSKLEGPYFKSKSQGIFLGTVTSDEIVVKGSDSYFKTEGSYSTFEGRIITSHAEHTTVVMGKIYEKWKEKGFVKGPLGFPKSDERVCPTSGAQGFETTGWVQSFEGGYVYYHSSGPYAHQVFETYGPVARKYEELGEIKSWLGFPTAGIENILGRYHQDFEGGYIGSLDGIEYHPFSLGASKIAFVWCGEKGTQIWVMNADGSHLTQLTSGYQDEDYWGKRYLAWSPDGSKVAFSYYDKGSAQIWVMNADGSHQKQLTHDDEYDCNYNPAWSPDGNKVAFWRVHGGYSAGIWVMNADGSHLTQLTSGYQYGNYYEDRYPAWSPDGNKIALVRSSRRRDEIWIVHADGSHQEQVPIPDTVTVLCAAANIGVAWSPDDEKIAFVGNYGIWVVNLDGSYPTQLTEESRNFYGQLTWLAPRPKHVKGKEEKINLSYSVDKFIPESATGNAFSLPVIKSPEYQAYFPWISSHIDTAWSVILPITFKVTDPKGNSVSGAQIYMGQQKLGVTDSGGKFTYKYVVRIPKRENKVIKLPFSAKKNKVPTSINIPFKWSVLKRTSIYIATKEDYDRYMKVLYEYEFFQQKLPLPKVLTPLSAFLPLLKIAHAYKVGPKIGDRIDIFLIEHKIEGKKPAVWAYWEQIKRGDKIPYYATGWIISPKSKQHVLDTYFFEKA